MALTLTHSTLTDPADRTEVEGNFTDVQNKFAGNIVNADISPSAAIDISKLSASYERLAIELRVFNDGTVINGLTAATPDLEDIADETILDITPLPGDSSDTNWEIYDASWVCTDTGDGASKLRVEWGYYSSTGVWTVTSTPISSFFISNANAANDANDAHQVNSSSTTLAFDANSPHNLALVYDVVSAGAGGTLSAAGSFFKMIILLRRVIQAS
jgi:hypothetical protein